MGTFATAGYIILRLCFCRLFVFAYFSSDGTFNFWDKDLKQRLKPFSKIAAPIPAAAFNNDGSLYAYASSYDWHKGVEYYNPSTAKHTVSLLIFTPSIQLELQFELHEIFVHPVVDAEIRPRIAAGAARRNR